MTLVEIDSYFKDKLKPILEKAGWLEGRSEKVKGTCLYWNYDYSENNLSIYKEFIGLTIKSPNCGDEIKFIECDDNFEPFEAEDDIWTLESHFSKLLNRKICFIGKDDDISRICIDEDNNFYSVCEYSISLYSHRSFYQGIYNFLNWRHEDIRKNPYHVKYNLPYFSDMGAYEKDGRGKLLWQNESDNTFFYKKEMEKITVQL